MTILINAYWDNRMPNLVAIMQSLEQSTVYPDKIRVFNNNPMLDLISIAGRKNLEIIASNTNYGYRAAYMSALLTDEEYYLVMDDDVSLHPDTIETFYSYQDLGVLGTLGKKLGEGDKPYTDNPTNLNGETITEPTKADCLIGKGLIWFQRKHLIEMLKLEQKLDFDYSREQDILISMANESYVIPTGIVELKERDVGYNRIKGHYDIRNNLVKQIQNENLNNRS